MSAQSTDLMSDIAGAVACSTCCQPPKIVYRNMCVHQNLRKTSTQQSERFIRLTRTTLEHYDAHEKCTMGSEWVMASRPAPALTEEWWPDWARPEMYENEWPSKCCPHV